MQASPWIGIANKQLKLMAKFMAELGLTPSSRSRLAIQVPTRPKPWEPLDEFFDDDLLAKPWR